LLDPEPYSKCGSGSGSGVKKWQFSFGKQYFNMCKNTYLTIFSPEKKAV
jgi:hypothetical protein